MVFLRPEHKNAFPPKWCREAIRLPCCAPATAAPSPAAACVCVCGVCVCVCAQACRGVVVVCGVCTKCIAKDKYHAA